LKINIQHKVYTRRTNGLSFLFVLLITFYVIPFSACKDKESPAPVQETGTVSDNEGNVYETIKIGDQWWTTENLRATKYRNGDPIQFITEDTLWKNSTIGSYCTFDNIANNINVTGGLYNWYAVNNANSIAPEGWHIPTDAEWKMLEKHLGMSNNDLEKVNWRGSNEAQKLKSTGQQEWVLYNNILPTNESGFSALAGNCRMFNGIWGSPLDLRSMGFWWTATDNPGYDQAWYRYLDSKKTDVFRFYGPKTYGFSVRCVKD